MIDFITTSFNSFQNQARKTIQYQNSSQILTQNVDNQSLSSLSNDKIMIYVKTKTKKAIKFLISTPIQLSDLNNKIQQKLKIKANSQILFLNGKNISQQKCLKLQQKQIIHVLSKEELATQNEPLKINLKVNNQKRPIYETFHYQFSASNTGNDLIRIIQREIKRKYEIPQEYSINLLYSSRLLNTDLTFEENKLCKQSQVICLFSGNQMNTISKNQQNKQNQRLIGQEILLKAGESAQKIQKRDENQNNTQNQQFYEKQEKQITNRIKQNIKEKSNAYLQSSNTNQSPAPKLRKKSQTLFINPSTPNFKKKRYFDEDGMTDQSTLLKRIKVSKSKKQIQQIIQLSLSNKKIQFQSNQGKEQVKSQVSSSSQQETNQKTKFTLYKPSPLIPKSMPSQQRNLIRQQIQKLFSSDISNQTQKQQMTKKTDQNISSKVEKYQIEKPKDESKQLQLRSYCGLKLNFTPKTQRKVINKNLRSTLGSNFDLSKLRAKKNRYDDQDKKEQ